MDNTAAQEIVKKPHTFDPVSGAYKELTKEPDPFYPKCKYAFGQAVVVNDAQEERALGAGWYDHPDQVPKVKLAADTPPVADSSDVVEALKGQIEALKAAASQQSTPKRRGRKPKAAEPTPEAQ